MASLSTADRLDLLLGWLNDEDWERNPRWEKELPAQIARFLDSFNGSPEAGYVRVEPEPEDPLGPVPDFLRHRQSPTGAEGINDYALLHAILNDLLARGFPHDEPRGFPEQIGVSLNFRIERRAPVFPRGRERRRLKKQAGAYVLRVSGSPFNLVRWLVMHLLTLPGAVVLMRCDAPRPRSAERCGVFFVPGDGRPRKFCSDVCRQRAYWEGDRTAGKGKAASRRRKRRRQK